LNIEQLAKIVRVYVCQQDRTRRLPEGILLYLNCFGHDAACLSGEVTTPRDDGGLLQWQEPLA